MPACLNGSQSNHEPRQHHVNSSLSDLEAQIAGAMLRQRFRFSSALKRIRADQKKNIDVGTRLLDLTSQVAESFAKRESRLASLPKAEVDQDLPIFDRQDEIIETIQQHQVTVISGQTGSGKSTQLPLMALKAGFGVSGLIGHTQPRRIAARGVAARIASQIGSPAGTDVGFKIRFDDKTSEKTYIKLMTDGILLAETQSDRFLEQYDLIIVDEAHELSLIHI